MDQVDIKSLIEFVAQAIDVDFDHVCHPLPIGFPKMLAQHASGYDLIRVTHEEFQKFVLCRGEINFMFVACNAAAR